MGLVFQNNAESGTNGVVVTTGNSGGGGNDAWSVIADGTTTPSYSSAKAASGSLSFDMTYNGGGFANLQCSISPNKTTLYISIKMYIPSSMFDYYPIVIYSSGSAIGFLHLSGGKVRLLDHFAGLIATSTTTLPTDSWIRIEYKVTVTGSSAQEARIFLNHNATTPTETLGGSTTTNSTITDVAFGADSPTMYLDEVIIRDDGYPVANSMTTAWLKF